MNLNPSPTAGDAALHTPRSRFSTPYRNNVFSVIESSVDRIKPSISLFTLSRPLITISAVPAKASGESISDSSDSNDQSAAHQRAHYLGQMMYRDSIFLCDLCSRVLSVRRRGQVQYCIECIATGLLQLHGLVQPLFEFNVGPGRKPLAAEKRQVNFVGAENHCANGRYAGGFKFDRQCIQ